MIRIELLKQRVAQFRKAAAHARATGNMFRDGQGDAFTTAADLIQVLITRHEPLQTRTARWVRETLGEGSLMNRRERCLRFIEEAIELVQALGCTKDDVLKMVDYVYNRTPGEPRQELGGTLVTTLALATCVELDAFDELHRELDRIENSQDAVRTKHQQKISEGFAEE